MSVRAYRVIKKKLANCSFSASHDTDILTFLAKDVGFFVATDSFGAGRLEVPVDRLKQLLATYRWEKDDYRKKAIMADIAWAKENKEDFIQYECY